jgi:glycine C-acetyltransferase
MNKQPTSMQRMQSTLDEIRAAGLYKEERVITTPQSVEIAVQDGSRVLNFCANNYLGLADHPELIEAAKQALDDHGFGLASYLRHPGPAQGSGKPYI